MRIVNNYKHDFNEVYLLLLAQVCCISYTYVMKKILLFVALFSFCALSVFTQENTPLDESSSDRPSVALVLSGAGARGFAHIPIIELMEELGIPIDFVVGTSSGAIIGGLYSAGYTGEEIAREMVYVDWPNLFQDSTNHLLESALGSHSPEANLINLQLTSELDLNLGRGLLSGQYVYNKIKSLTAKIPSYIDFDDLSTPYRATVVDLLSGELVFLDEGDLSDAIRASMSIPGAFEPFPVNGRYYLDGFIKNNLPIEAARELGYDIVIAVDMSDRMVEDANVFNANPLVALNQILALQQADVISEGYQYADLVILPNVYEFGNMDYGFAPEIYEKGKIEAERYRDDLIALRSQIFSNNATDFKNTIDSSEKKITYTNIDPIVLQDIVFYNAFSSDEKMLTSKFNTIKGKPLSGDDLNAILTMAYQTGNYIMVTSRINTIDEKSVLELDFYQKTLNTIQVGVMQAFEGTLSESATWEIGLSSTLQFRDIYDTGGILSIQGTFLSKTGLEVMYFQPFNDKMFLRGRLNGYSILDIEHSGYTNTEVKDSHFRQGSLALAFGIFFSPEHRWLNEIGIHTIDSTQAETDIVDGVLDINNLKIAYSLDVFSRYTYDNVDYTIFPTRGFYNDFTVTGVLPLEETTFPVIFDVVTTDFVGAIPFNINSSLVFNGFIGTNITEELSNHPKLMTKYGFTTYDRTFFPHVMQRYSYGIHKFALKTDLQFQPSQPLTIIGGQFFSGLGGAVGGVLDSYEELLSFDDLEWQASALMGLRIKDAIGAIIRIGAGSYGKDIAPFASLDFMVKLY